MSADMQAIEVFEQLINDPATDLKTLRVAAVTLIEAIHMMNGNSRKGLLNSYVSRIDEKDAFERIVCQHLIEQCRRMSA